MQVGRQVGQPACYREFMTNISINIKNVKRRATSFTTVIKRRPMMWRLMFSRELTVQHAAQVKVGSLLEYTLELLACEHRDDEVVEVVQLHCKLFRIGTEKVRAVWSISLAIVLPFQAW